MSHPTNPTTTSTTTTAASTTGHSNVTMTTAEAVPLLMARDFDELEGSLLPTAQQVEDDANNGNTNNHNVNNAMAAIPTEVFRYDEATLAKEQQQQQQQQQYEQGQGEREGYAIPISTGVAPDDERTVRKAEQMGIIRSEQEKEAIRKANRQVFAHNYHEQIAIQLANEAAKRRDREGLQVMQPPPRQQEDQKEDHRTDDDESRLKNNTNKGTRKGGKGYQFRDYDMTDTYETQKYDVKEYKSVYD